MKKIRAKKFFYVTTPIYYINYTPSVGSAYPTIIADIFARWHKLCGEKVFFLTGLDENSTKTVQAAKNSGYGDIQKYADYMAQKWVDAWKKLDIDYDNFIRTTDKDHKKTVRKIFLKIKKNGDIYKSAYEGLYCEGCEAFYTEKDLIDGKCPYHKTVPKKISEENYFFKLAKYQKKLLEHIENNPDFIMPKTRRNEVVSFIKEGLKDVSISRPGLDWGIEIPGDKTQRFWVWLDALTNYISGSKNNWPASLHIVGKDIIRFHCILWPAFLMSAGYELPENIFAHGFFTVNGEKMSKSLGNVVDPVYLADTYGVDTLRYYLVREIRFGEDGNFSTSLLIERYNNELANDLGNLLNRVLSLAEKKLSGTIPKDSTDEVLSSQLDVEKISLHMENFELNPALSEIFSFISACNKYVNDNKVWALEGKDAKKALYSLLDSLRIIAILLFPFIPQTSLKICRQLNVRLGGMKDAKFNLLKSTKLGKREILFTKIEIKN